MSNTASGDGSAPECAINFDQPTYLGLGSNLGERRKKLGAALEGLEAAGISVAATSSVYETAPVGPVEDQPAFLNMVARVVSTLAPLALLETCLEVERQLGRQRQGAVAKGPRIIDVDLLLMGQRVEHLPGLDLPHPELARRAFVLQPLLELDPELLDPRDGNPLRKCLTPLLAMQLITRVGRLEGR
jgi:2-amino-4-hydroxy-6-hydroxymethyldihydropteridine diphosphokinase